MGKDRTNLTDQSLMAFGKHKGAKLEDVPASYLLWLWNQNARSSGENSSDECRKVLRYTEENMSALQKESPDTIVDKGSIK